MSLILVEAGRPFVLVHVPKTGGTSIRQGRQKSTARMYTPDAAWAEFPSFGVVRDPYDRIESCWRDFRFLRKMTNYDFPDFVDWVASRMGREDLIASPSTVEHHAAPMTHPVHGLIFAGFVGRTERLQQDFNVFCAAAKLKAFRLLKLRDAGSAPRAKWTDETRRIVRQIYARDFAWLEARC